MAPKRPPAADPESSSSEEDEQEEEEEVNLSSPSPKKPPSSASSKKPENPPSSKPPRNPSDEDDDEDDEDDDGSDDSDPDEKSKKKPPPQSQSQSQSQSQPQPQSQSQSQSQSQPQLKPRQPLPKPDSGSSSDDDGSSEDEDDDEPPPAQRPSRGVDPSIKPISSRPMDASPKPKKPSSSSSEPPPKKPKTSSSDAAPPSEQKRQLFQRLWGPEDEIAVLRGIAEYRSKKGSLPSSSQDMDTLRGHVRGALQVEVTNQQLSDKIRRLKKKFATNAARGKNGADPKFTKDHERAAFEISKKIWGAASKSSPSANADAETDEEKSEESDDDMGSEQNVKEENNNKQLPAATTVANGKAEHLRGKLSFPYLKEAVDELAKEHPCGSAFKRAFEFLDEPRAKGMEEKLKKLRMDEIKQHLRRMDLMKETVKMMLEALARSD